MIRDSSDASWERIGRENPYFGVLTDPRFRGRTLDRNVKAEFLSTGEDYVTATVASIERHFGGLTRTEAALDFGCGVGRVAIPLAARFGRVVGVDISPAMLAEAERNCAERGVRNIEFVRSDDRLTAVTGSFDLIHSVITFQHIPRRRGEAIIQRLLELLAAGGFVVLQVHVFRPGVAARQWASRARGLFRPLHWALNILQGRPWNEPLMQHNVYDMGRVLRLFAGAGVRDVQLDLEPGGSAVLVGRKRR